jgi:predicted RecA/RadA family phage recombinase
MGTTFKETGVKLTLLAPSGGVTRNLPALIGALLMIPDRTAAEGVEFVGVTEGVHTLVKTSAQAWTVGQKVYWNVGTSKCDTDGTTGPLIGVATEVAANPTATGVVRLNGVAPDVAEGPQATIAALTFGTNIAAATANGALADSSATNPTEAQFNELAKELGTKINDIIAALKAAGVVASA